MAVNRTKVLEAAQKFLSKGQYDKAIAEYQKLVSEDPRDVRTLLKIGDLHTRRNKPKDAIDVYQKVAELYAKQGFFLKAVAVYKQILKLDPTHIDSSQKLAKMYEELALTSDALTTYEQVADAYLNQGQVPKAIETMQRMVDLDPSNIAVRIKFAEALSKADKQREAAKAFAEGAALLKEQGRMDDYIRVVERQLYHDPENLDVARELSSMYLERSDPKRALAKLQICFKADPRDVQTLEMLAEAFRQLGQIPKTISVLKEIARLHQELNAHEPRKRTLKRILDLDPNDAEAKQGLGSIGNAAPAPAAAPAAQAAKPANANANAAKANVNATQPMQTRKASDFPVPDPDDFDLEVDDEGSDDDDVFMVGSDHPPAPQGRAQQQQPAPAQKPAPAAAAPSRAEAPAPRAAAQQAAPQPAPRAAAPSASKPQPAPAAAAPSVAKQPEPARSPAEAKASKITRLLDEADKQEGAGRYDAAESLLKQVLEFDADHLPTHERLKDLYLATDRRVDAVRELLWLSETWNLKNRERATQYAKAAYDLAPNAAATRNRMRELGVDPDHEKQEEVMFVDDSRATALERDDTGDASLDAIMPRMGDAPNKVPPPSVQERLPRGTVDRAGPAQEDPLDVPLSPDDFDAPPPRVGTPVFARDVAAKLLEQPMLPEEFETQHGFTVQVGATPPLLKDAGGYDDMAALLDAPISPDDFDAPPPKREREQRRDVKDLLDQPLPPDDFGLSDERFERSGLMDMTDEPGKASIAPPAISTVPPGRARRAEMVAEEDDDEPSIEFAEINTGEVDITGAEPADDLDLTPGAHTLEHRVEERASLPVGERPTRPSSDFADLGTGEIITVQSDPPPPAKPPVPPPALSPAALKGPAPMDLKQPKLPDFPTRVAPTPAAALQPPAPAPQIALKSKKDETDWSDLDFDAPDPTLRGEPIPELVRQSIREVDVPTPAALPVVSDETEGLFMTPVPREEPTETLVVPEGSFGTPHLAELEDVRFTVSEPSSSAGAFPNALPSLIPDEIEFTPIEATPSIAPAAVESLAPPRTPDGERLPPEVEEAMDEADFFASQGMLDEALEAIQEAILIYPNVRALKSKLAEYETQADEKDAAAEEKVELQEDESFDIAQQLATELAEPAGQAAGPDEMVDVESVFAQFKKGVAAQISPDDSDTHFDLGIAYKEMGLIDDAVQEFETASRGATRACTALTMIGMCFLERNDVPRAVEHFERALATKHKSPAEELALHYELGNAHELMGQYDRAVAAFEKVASKDRTFRGVSGRLDQLKKRGIKSAGAIG